MTLEHLFLALLGLNVISIGLQALALWGGRNNTGKLPKEFWIMEQQKIVAAVREEMEAFDAKLEREMKETRQKLRVNSQLITMMARHTAILEKDILQAQQLGREES
ncbi:MAG: hypothetical protein L0Z53_26930 [Acidobacteriales bacterium]|nr:hypothetical protein [Terriglobales bacterium]